MKHKNILLLASISSIYTGVLQNPAFATSYTFTTEIIDQAIKSGKYSSCNKAGSSITNFLNKLQSAKHDGDLIANNKVAPSAKNCASLSSAVDQLDSDTETIISLHGACIQEIEESSDDLKVPANRREADLMRDKFESEVKETMSVLKAICN